MILITGFSNILEGQACRKWIFGYVPTYTQATNGSIHYLQSSDYEKLTHIGHLGPYVNADGSFNMNSNGATHTRLMQGVIDAHNHGKPILMAFQAWFDQYYPAISNPVSRANLIDNVLDLLDTYGYDGVDVDLEPIMSPYIGGIQSDNPFYVQFINTLYDSLQTRICAFTNQKPLLTVAANGYAGPVLSQVQNKLDMINIMTYDLSGPYPGWVTWHDSPVYNGGNVNPYTGQFMPSVQGELSMCINAGVLPGKLSVGVSMDAFRWKGGTGTPTGGVTAPMQSYTSDPTWNRFSYSDFMQNYFANGIYHYDSGPQMSYLSVDNTGSSNDEFWSFNDQNSCEDKVDFVWDFGIGGTMIWELHSGYFSGNISGNRIPQLNYIYDQNCLRAASCPDPYPWCQGESYTLSAPVGYVNYQWYKNGIAIPGPVGTSNSIIASETGVYYWTALETNGCPVNVCCPVEIIDGNCCELISAGKSNEVCNNNGTQATGTDDYITFSLFPTGTGLGTGYNVTVNAGGSLSRIGGGALTDVPYDSPVNFRLQSGSANGTIYTITITDNATGSCQVLTTLQQNGCSQCPAPDCLNVGVFKN